MAEDPDGHPLRAAPDDLHALVVDDDTDLAGEIGEALEDSGIRVTMAVSFAGALDILDNDPSVNVVLSDYFLDAHRANGMQLIDCCRARFPDRPFRFGLMSGDRFALTDNLQDEAVLKVLKPLIPENFADHIRALPAFSHRIEPRL